MKVFTLIVITLLTLPLLTTESKAEEGASYVQTPYTAQKVLFDFYLDDPAKMAPALYWIRSLMNPLMDDPYDYAPDSLSLKVLIHGTEIVTLAKKNYKKYKDVVDRMRYYASLGVEFRVCSLAAGDYGYRLEDFQDFVKLVPSGITELAYWQLQGYAVVRPIIMEKKYSIEEIR